MYKIKSINKKGLSPIIATVLLISLALVLALIIFIWARSVIKEKVTKFGETIESACKDVSFNAELERSGKVNINNLGNVPLYGVEVRKRGVGIIKNVGAGYFGNGLEGLPKGAGKTTNIDLGNPSIGEEFIIVPILLGETDLYKKPYTCSDDFGKIAEVVA
ncbi:MAG: archaellin/type IV pilin N-terminal domain-containing protein [Nanoarchaeota archaeon]